MRTGMAYSKNDAGACGQGRPVREMSCFRRGSAGLLPGQPPALQGPGAQLPLRLPGGSRCCSRTWLSRRSVHSWWDGPCHCLPFESPSCGHVAVGPRLALQKFSCLFLFYMTTQAGLLCRVIQRLTVFSIKVLPCLLEKADFHASLHSSCPEGGGSGRVGSGRGCGSARITHAGGEPRQRATRGDGEAGKGSHELRKRGGGFR